MITIALVIIAVWIAIGLLKGVLRWILLIAGLAFAVFFLIQPASVSPSARAAIAAHEVVHEGKAVVPSKIVVRNWQKLAYTIQHGL